MPLSPIQTDQPKIRTASDWLRLVCYGLCMGTADIIPGISGGTIAFIMGFYEDLLNSIKSLNTTALNKLFHGHFRQFWHLISWKFLSGLITGIVIAMVCLAHAVTYILNHEQYRELLYASFLGLIIAAAWLCGLQLKRWKLTHLFVFLLTALIAFVLTGSSLSQMSSEDLFDIKVENANYDKALRNYDPDTQMLLDIPYSTASAMFAKGIIASSSVLYSHHSASYGTADQLIQASGSLNFDWWIILCGAIAMSAMILPGISGSYLLTILGMYATVVGALADFAGSLAHGHFDGSSFMILTNMLIGIVLGAIIATRCVSWILNNYHDLAIAALTGFMIGALQSVWPFWNYQYMLLPLHLEKGPQLETTQAVLPNLAAPETWVAFSLAILGAGAVFVFHYIAQAKTKTKIITTE